MWDGWVESCSGDKAVCFNYLCQPGAQLSIWHLVVSSHFLICEENVFLKDLVCPITDANTTWLFYLITDLRDVTENIGSFLSFLQQQGWNGYGITWSKFKSHLQHSLTVWLWAGSLPPLEWLFLLGNDIRGEVASEDFWKDWHGNPCRELRVIAWSMLLLLSHFSHVRLCATP